MKRCPACSRVYDDDSLRFCLDDGTTLVDKLTGTQAPPTLAFPENFSSPTIKHASPQDVPAAQKFEPSAGVLAPKRNLLPWLLGAGAVLILGSGLVFALLFLRQNRTLTWHLVLELEPTTLDREAAVKQAVSVIENRLNAFGVSSFEVLPQGDPANGRIVVNLPDVRDPERLKHVISDLGKLELTHVVSPPSPAPVQTYSTKEEAIASLDSSGTIPENRRVLPYGEQEGEFAGQPTTKWVLVESPPIIDGSDLRTASAVRSIGNNYNIQFSLTQTGAQKFGEWTGANINEYLGVVLNDEVKSIAYIKSQIFDQGEISGRFTKQAAEDLALILKSGALPAPVRIVSEDISR